MLISREREGKHISDAPALRKFDLVFFTASTLLSASSSDHSRNDLSQIRRNVLKASLSGSSLAAEE